MAKKIKIVIDFKEDNSLLAVSCHKKDYWIAFQLNETLKLKLKRVDDFPYFNSKLDRFVFYSLFYCQSKEDQTSYYLISNSNPEGKLFPAYKTSDYFLLSHGRSSKSDHENRLQKARTIKGILGVFNTEMNKIKDIDNFFSDLELHMIDVLKNPLAGEK